MSDFLPSVWGDMQEAALNEAIAVGMRCTRALARHFGPKGYEALKVRYNQWLNSASAHEALPELEKDALLREQEADNLFSVLEKIDVEIRENPRDQDAPEIPLEDLDPDWFMQWRQGASSVSNDEMQKWWSRLLREQVSQPARYSLRTLAQLRQMSPEEAHLVEKAASYVLDNSIVVLSDSDLQWSERGHNHHNKGNKPELPQPDLFELIDLGLVAGRTHEVNMGNPGRLCGSTHKLVLGKIPNSMVQGASNRIETYPLTRVGRELCGLASANTDEKYLESLARVYEQSRAWRAQVRPNATVVAMNGLDL